jgi:hypothetical protein
MTDISTVLLRCHICKNSIGSIDIENIDQINQEVIHLLVSPMVHIVCNNCQECEHCFED